MTRLTPYTWDVILPNVIDFLHLLGAAIPLVARPINLRENGYGCRGFENKNIEARSKQKYL